MPKEIILFFRSHVPNIVYRLAVVLTNGLYEVLQGCDVCTTARGKQYTEDDVSHKFHLPPPIGSNVIFISPTFVSISSPTVKQQADNALEARDLHAESVLFFDMVILLFRTSKKLVGPNRAFLDLSMCHNEHTH